MSSRQTRCPECRTPQALTPETEWTALRCSGCARDFRAIPDESFAVLADRETRSARPDLGAQAPRRVVFAEDLRSEHNVGSLFRTADGAGWDHVFLAGISPTPEKSGVAKTALGAEQTVSWSYRARTTEALDALLSVGYHLIGLEQTQSAIALEALSLEPTRRIALLVGNEVWGLSPEALRRCHQTVAIPMRGQKRSLNVSVAFGIAAYAIAPGLV